MTYYFSIESRKGGVGKTTVALNLGAKLLENGYKVLLLDCDITGTSISICSENSDYWKDTVHVIKKADKKKEAVAVNLLDYFKNCYLIGKEETWIKMDGSVFDLSKLNVIGTELYDEEKLVIDPRVLMDELHSYWVITMLQELSDEFSKSGDKNQNTAIIIDNSPGYAGMGRAVHEWLSDIGPQYARFLLVSSLDEQDIKSSVYSLKEIKRMVEGKARVKKYYNQLEGDNAPTTLDEKEEEHLKSDGCFDRFFYRLASGFEYRSSTDRDYKLKEYAAIIFNKVSEDIRHPDFYYDFKEVLTDEYLKLLSELLGEGERSAYLKFMVPFDYNIHLQFFGHRLKNLRSGTEKYWKNRFAGLRENIIKKRANRNVVKASLSLDNLIHTLKISMRQKGQGRMADDIKDTWMIRHSLNKFKIQITDIAYYNKPDNRLDFNGVDKKDIINFNKLSLDLFVNKKDLTEYEPILASFFSYLYEQAGAKKPARDIRLLVTVSVFCNALRCVHENDFKEGSYESFLQEQCDRNMSGNVLKQYVGDYVPITGDVSLPTEIFQGVVGECFEDFYKTSCYAILRMYHRFDDFLLLTDVLEMLISSSQYREIPSDVMEMLDDMIVKMLKPRDSKAFKKVINDKLRMTVFEGVINHITQIDWKL